MGSECPFTPPSLTPSSEPEQGQRATSPTAYSQNSLPAPRSCYGCNRKKIRCDKKEPCSSCGRAGRPCAYPPSGPRTRRAKKTIIADMASRISSLEKSLAQAKNEAQSAQTASHSKSLKSTPLAQPVTTLHSSNPSQRSREDVLVQNGSSSQYFNEVIFSRVIEDVRHTDESINKNTWF